MPAGDQSKRCENMFASRGRAAIEHVWHVANGVPYCVYEDTSGNALEQIPPPKGFTCRPWDEIMQQLKIDAAAGPDHGARVIGCGGEHVGI